MNQRPNENLALPSTKISLSSSADKSEAKSPSVNASSSLPSDDSKEFPTPGLIYIKEVNLSTFPNEKESDKKITFPENTNHFHQITIGDLYANTLKLLHVLVRHGVLSITKENYQQFATLYAKNTTDFTKEDLESVRKIINSTKSTQAKPLIRLIGDELSDRGSNDFFTLLLFQKMAQEKIPFEILLSNHSIEFIEAIERHETLMKDKKNFGSYLPKLSEAFCRSMHNLRHLIEKGLIDLNEVLLLVNKYYRPALKALSYTLDSDRKKITLYTHAPVDLKTDIPAIASHSMIDVPFDDSTAETLAKTIDAINYKFSTQVVHHLYTSRIVKKAYEESRIDQWTDRKDNPFEFLILNRALNQLERSDKHTSKLLKSEQPYNVHYVHGHDHQKNKKDSTHITNLYSNPDILIADYSVLYTRGIYSILSKEDYELAQHTIKKNKAEVEAKRNLTPPLPLPSDDSKKFPTPGLIYIKKVSLSNFPNEKESDKKITFPEDTDQFHQITIGDLHANALKLLHMLVRHGVLSITKENYQQFVALYEKSANHFTKEDLESVRKIINSTKSTQAKPLIRLIGDELSDRGSNDFFTLLLFQKMAQEKIPFEILLSNHSIEFIEAIEKHGTKEAKEVQDFNSYKPRIDKLFYRSMDNLRCLIKEGIINLDEVLFLFRKYYKPALKALSYTLDTDRKKITLYTHAPIDLKTDIPAIARHPNIDVPFDDSTAEALAKTIDTINYKFSTQTVHHLYTNRIVIEGYNKCRIDQWTNREDNPFAFLILNRALNQLERSDRHTSKLFKLKQPYNVHYVHGHDSKIDKKNMEHVTNLDNTLGKGFTDTADDYSVLYAQGSYSILSREEYELTQHRIEKNKIESKRDFIKNNEIKALQEIIKNTNSCVQQAESSDSPPGLSAFNFKRLNDKLKEIPNFGKYLDEATLKLDPTELRNFYLYGLESKSPAFHIKNLMHFLNLYQLATAPLKVNLFILKSLHDAAKLYINKPRTATSSKIINTIIETAILAIITIKISAEADAAEKQATCAIKAAAEISKKAKTLLDTKADSEDLLKTEVIRIAVEKNKVKEAIAAEKIAKEKNKKYIGLMAAKFIQLRNTIKTPPTNGTMLKTETADSKFKLL